MATNYIRLHGQVTEIPDSQTGQDIYADLASWDRKSEDNNFNRWETSPGSETANITLELTAVEDADISTGKQNLRDLLDQIDSDHGSSHNINQFKAVEV